MLDLPLDSVRVGREPHGISTMWKGRPGEVVSRALFSVGGSQKYNVGRGECDWSDLGEEKVIEYGNDGKKF